MEAYASYGDSTQLLYLRARFYNAADGRFQSRDTWGGSANIPRSYNKWNYVDSNPVNYIDPWGLKKTIVFFFPGFSNEGDTNRNGEFSFSELNEGSLAKAVKDISDVTIVPIYPYASGLERKFKKTDNTRDEYIEQLTRWMATDDGAALAGNDIAKAKVSEVLHGLEGVMSVCTTWAHPFNKEYQIVFMAYSAGGQIAYATSQELKGKLFVDKMVLIGSPYNAFNKTSNIGELWEIWGEHDLGGSNILSGDISGLGGFLYTFYGWRQNNEGSIFYPPDSIYNNGATRCVFKDDGNNPYGHLDYIEGTGNDAGVSCTGAHPSQRGATGGNRLDALMDLIKNQIGVGKP